MALIMRAWGKEGLRDVGMFLFRTFLGVGVPQWNVDRALAEIAPPTGLRVSLAGEEAKQCLRMRVDWQSTGMQDWRRVGKNLKDIERTVVERLRAGGWSITTHGVATRSMHVEATLGVEYARKNLADTATALDHILERVRFS